MGSMHPQALHHHPVPAAAPGKPDPLRYILAQVFNNPERHHLTQPRHDVPLFLTLVQGVGAVALAEHGASPGHLVGLVDVLDRHGLLHADAKSLDLLQKKLSGAGGAFIPGKEVDNLVGGIYLVGGKGLSAGAGYVVGVPVLFLEVDVGVLDRLRFGNGGQPEQVFKLPPRQCYPAA